ncbi:MAG: hypothetical protein AAGE52_02825 [Myxococcota bacterium]
MTYFRKPLTLRRALAYGGLLLALLCGCFTPSGHHAHTTPARRAAPSETAIQAAAIPRTQGAPHVLSLFAMGVPDDLPVKDQFELANVDVVQRIPQRFIAAGEPVGQLMDDLRLHAARAGSDMLVVLDFDIEHASNVNGWYALSPLLVPLLAAPWMTLEVNSRLDWYVVDVASGVYVARGSIDAEPRSRRVSPINAQRRGDAMVDAHREALVLQASHDIRLLFATWAAENAG